MDQPFQTAVPSPARVAMRMPRDILEALRRSGTRHRRDRTSEVLHYVEEGLIRDGFLPGRAT